MVLSNFESTLATIIEENVEKGRKEGMEKGMKKGMEKGIEKGRVQIIKAMLNLKVADEIIIATTGIDKKELERVKKKQEV